MTPDEEFERNTLRRNVDHFRDKAERAESLAAQLAVENERLTSVGAFADLVGEVERLRGLLCECADCYLSSYDINDDEDCRLAVRHEARLHELLPEFAGLRGESSGPNKRKGRE